MNDERDTNGERLVKLGGEDKRKLYALLDADLPGRSRRLEIGVAVLFVATVGDRGAQLLSGQSPTAALLEMIF